MKFDFSDVRVLMPDLFVVFSINEKLLNAMDRNIAPLNDLGHNNDGHFLLLIDCCYPRLSDLFRLLVLDFILR